MSVHFTVLLVAAGLAAAAGAAALATARATRREVSALRQDLTGLTIPAPRESTADIRTAVAEALSDERERELAEARAFWAEQEAREAAAEGFRGAHGMVVEAGDYADLTDFPDLPELPDLHDLPDLPGYSDFPVHPTVGHDVPPVLPFLPRQADFAGLEPGSVGEPETSEAVRPAPGAIPHPSGPDFAPSPVVASQDQTADRLSDLADGRIPLSDVRPGPLGTLDVYVFADGTTLCMTPGHRETALRLCEALDRGEAPVLRGGSAIAGAYALTFAYGDQSVYVLADRVVASL